LTRSETITKQIGCEQQQHVTSNAELQTKRPKRSSNTFEEATSWGRKRTYCDQHGMKKKIMTNNLPKPYSHSIITHISTLNLRHHQPLTMLAQLTHAWQHFIY